MKKLTFRTLEELAKNTQKISELELGSFVGGGDGSSDSPYTWNEMYDLMDTFRWNGGYVEYMGYVAPQYFAYGSQYGGFCNQYNCDYVGFLDTMKSSGWDQFAGWLLSKFPVFGEITGYEGQELNDLKVAIAQDLFRDGYTDRQLNYVTTPSNYSCVTTDTNITHSIYDAVTGELLVSYKINAFGVKTKIK